MADVGAETLLKVVLVLAVVWLGLEVLAFVVDVLLGPFRSIVGLLVVVLVVLYLLDRL